MQVQAKMETLLSRFEPLARLEDPFFLNEVAMENPGLLKYLPSSQAAFETYVPILDQLVTAKIDQIMKATPGHPSYSVDGVTVNGKNHLLVTQLKGGLRRFCDMHQLGHHAHVTDEEADAVAATINREDAAIDDTSVGTHVDNAAAAMASKLKEKLNNKQNLVSRDCAHTIDLHAKDAAKDQSALGAYIRNVKDMVGFCKRDQIDGIRTKLISTGLISDGVKASFHSDTRQYGASLMCESLMAQRRFLHHLYSGDDGDCCSEYVEYYNKQTADEQEKLDMREELVTKAFWKRLAWLQSYFGNAASAVKLVSTMGMPISIYYPTVGVLEAKDKVLLASASDPGCGIEDDEINFLEAISASRINMDVLKCQRGRKAKMLDEYHVWAFLLDPYLRALCLEVPSKGVLIKNMCKSATTTKQGGREGGRRGGKRRRGGSKREKGVWHIPPCRFQP